MISVTDMLGLCGLDPDQIDAIAEHEHLPDVAAAALAAYLIHERHGLENIRDMILDDIRVALAQGRTAHASELVMALRHLHDQNPGLANGG